MQTVQRYASQKVHTSSYSSVHRPTYSRKQLSVKATQMAEAATPNVALLGVGLMGRSHGNLQAMVQIEIISYSRAVDANHFVTKCNQHEKIHISHQHLLKWMVSGM